jgi:DUF2914 family protein/tetratricopeptide repeat protein
MQKPNDVRKFVIGAEQAEARGDHAEAERLLRRALVLQEFSLGAEHIEVAKTLNNLAIVSEMNGRLGDAEACYRRAFAIAVSKLAPTDPFFVTSRENLEQFCQARGLPFNSPPVPPRSSPDAPMRPPAPPPRAAAPPTTAPPKTAAPPSDATLLNPAAPEMTIAVPRAAAPPKPVTPPRTATPATAAPPASMADMPFLSETAISQTSVPTRAATPQKPVTPRTSQTASAARSVPLEDMPFRSEAAKAPRSAPDPAATLPITHSAVPVPPARRGSSRAILLALAALVLIGAGWYWFASSALPERAASSAVATGGDAPAPAADPALPERQPSPPAPRATAEPETAAPPAAKPTVPPPAPAASAPGVATAPAPPSATTRPSSSVTVVTSQACRSLTRSDAWTCTPATGTQSPGRLYFYTRVASPRDTTIEHRWYRGDRLEQSVPLSIRANAAGYRTYSQLAIGPDRAGSWKVELRTQDGQVLDQQTFSVR